jgi:predicted helicase
MELLRLIFLSVNTQFLNLTTYDQASIGQFTKKHLYFDKMLVNSIYLFGQIFPTAVTEQENRVIWIKVGTDWHIRAYGE